MSNGSLIPTKGDVVTLISGGPPMTVEGLETAPVTVTPLAPGASPQILVRCVWFNPAGGFARAMFDAGVLAASGPAGAPVPAKSSPSAP